MDEEGKESKAPLTNSPDTPDQNSIHQSKQDARQDMGGLFSEMPVVIKKKSSTWSMKRYLQRADPIERVDKKELKDNIPS